jgi:Nuclease-related domain
VVRGSGARPVEVDSRDEALVAVRRELSALPHGWHVLHDVGVSGEHIDHLVMGPVGIVTLTTKFHPRARVTADGRQLRVNGVEVDHLRHARVTARRVGGEFSAGPMDQTPVTGGVVFVGLAGCHLDETSTETVVTIAGRAINALRALPHRLSTAEVDELSFAVLRRVRA